MRDVERRGFGASKKRGSTGELALQESSDLLARPRAGVGRGRGGCCLFLPSLSESQFGSSTVTLLVGSLDGFSILLTCGRCTYAPRSQANGKNLSKSKRSRDSFVTVHTHERTSFCPGSYRQILCGGRGPVRPRPRVASVRAAKRDAHPDTSRDRARTALKT